MSNKFIFVKKLAVITATLVLISIFVFSLVLGFDISQNKKFASLNQDGVFNIFNLIPAATNVILNDKVDQIKGEAEGRTNFLLLGLDPENGLSDTIMILSFYHKEKKLVSVNIPRDFYISSNKVGVTNKINAVYPLVRDNNPNDKLSAGNTISQFIYDEFNLPIHYWTSINVSGLRQVVDLIGGIEVNVETAFTDYTFPRDDYNGYLVPAPSFEQGNQTMDGFKASIYARSRHSANLLEGSDFARSKRQSIVIQGILKKLSSLGLWGNITKLNDYLNILGENVLTNATSKDLIDIGYKIKDLNIQENFSRIVWTSNNGFLCTPPQDERGYIITYGDNTNCGNFIAGSRTTNKYKTIARGQLSNLLNQSYISEVSKLDFQIYYSTNQFLNSISNDLDLDLDNPIYIPNFQKSINKNSSEKYLFYIENLKNKENFELSQTSFKDNIQFIDTLPEEILSDLKANKVDLSKAVIIIEPKLVNSLG
jgi:LCP family protein required for cell wall assembly